MSQVAWGKGGWEGIGGDNNGLCCAATSPSSVKELFTYYVGEDRGRICEQSTKHG